MLYYPLCLRSYIGLRHIVLNQHGFILDHFRIRWYSNSYFATRVYTLPTSSTSMLDTCPGYVLILNASILLLSLILYIGYFNIRTLLMVTQSRQRRDENIYISVNVWQAKCFICTFLSVCLLSQTEIESHNNSTQSRDH